MPPTTCKEEALKRRGEGRSVIPIYGIQDGACTCGRSTCESPGKHPILPSWKEFQQRLPSTQQIEGWFRQHPDANAAEITGNGVMVEDIDRVGANPEFATRTVRTGGGGLHYYWATNKRWKNSAKGDVHVRGEGGYVLIPPSTHKSGNRYEYIQEGPPARMERGAIKLIDPEAVFAGNRHDAAGKFIGHLFKEGKGVHEVRKALMQWNEEHVYPSLSQSELNRYIDDVATKEHQAEGQKVVPERFLPMLEFLSTYSPVREQWLVQDWLPYSSAGIVSGLPGTYKTWLLLELALSLSSGKPFLNAFTIPAPRPVVLCQLEDDYTLLAGRIRTLLGGCEPAFEDGILTTVLQPDLPFYLYDGRRLDISNANSVKALEEFVGDHRAGLLAIDPMNAAVNMEDYGIKSVASLNRLKEIRDRTGCTLLFGHHDQKSASVSTRTSTYGTVFFDAWKEYGWNITKLAQDTVRIKRHAKLTASLSDVVIRFLLEQADFETEEGA
jgi:hypothetical protein